jgi:uncharacterized protein YndB with AHSA1/START domain
MDNDAQSITIVRTFDAPIEKVWDAWTTVEGWTAWFGSPGHVEEGSVEIDAKVGGKWKSKTIYAAGDITFSGSFSEMDKPNKLVMRWDDENPSNEQVEIVTVHFKDLGDHKTEMNFTQSGHLPPEEYQKGLKDGWTGFFNALESYLSR